MAATSSIAYYLTPNQTGKTSGYFAHIIPNGTAYFADIVADVTGSLSTTEQRLKMAWNETIRVALVYARAGYTVDLGGVRIRMRIPGSMPCEDSSFEPTIDSLIIDAYGDNEIASVFENVIPYRVSLTDVAATIRVSNIMDVTTEAFGTVIGTTQFAVLGNGITLDGEDEYVKAYHKKTGALLGTAVVDRVERGQRGYCHFATSLADGDVNLVIATHGLAGETSLRTFSKPVKAIYVAAPPELTKIKEGTRPDNTVGFTESKVTITGTNIGGFKTGDQLRLEGVPSGAAYLASMSLNSFVTASDETSITLGQGFENLSEKPDTDWDNKQAVVTLVRDGASYPLTFNFQNA